MSRALPALSSIPETDEEKQAKWVPKKKHEVLKAKYKCLKKLFQIYDASMVAMMPQNQFETQAQNVEETPKKTRRKKRSIRTKPDLFLCASESNHGDVSDVQSEAFCSVSRDYIPEKHECSSSTTQSDIRSINASTQDSRLNINCKSVLALQKECNHTQTVPQDEPTPPQIQNPISCLMFNEKPQMFPPPAIYLEKRRITRFQSFLQRILGIRRERTSKPYVLPNGHILASSDNNIIERRKRRGLRFRRLRRPKVIKSEGDIMDMKDPVILNYVQCVQRSCLLDTTPRHCPIVGCRMMFYGIINYNDHLNLCHFKERKYICHYCHEGFESVHEKYVHENEHIGISKLNVVPTVNPPAVKAKEPCVHIKSESQMEKEEVQQAKLKKIVSFFDKIVDSSIVSEMRKCQCSETTFTSKDGSVSEKKTISCTNTCQSRLEKTCSERTDFTKMSVPSNKCKICGETFANRRQLSFHVDLEHRCTDKFSKFHSCAGIINSKIYSSMTSDDGKIQVDSRVGSECRIHRTPKHILTHTDLKSRKSDESLSCSSMVYSSMEAFPSVIKSKKALNYKWEPNNNVIRV